MPVALFHASHQDALLSIRGYLLFVKRSGQLFSWYLLFRMRKKASAPMMWSLVPPSTSSSILTSATTVASDTSARTLALVLVLVLVLVHRSTPASSNGPAHCELGQSQWAA